MPKTMNFSENLEKGLAKIGHRVHENLNNHEARARPEREIIKESILSLAQEISEAPTSPNTQTSSSDDSEEFSYLPSYFIDEDSVGDDAKKAVEHLVDVALHGDIEKAIKMSKKYPPFVEDAFHDALVDKLVPELKKRGILA